MEKTLGSIVDITAHDSLDSLEPGFIDAISNILPISAISIHRILRSNVYDGIEEIISLAVFDGESGERRRVWQKQSKCPDLLSQIDACFAQASSCDFKVDEETYRILIPIFCQKQSVGVVRVDSEQELGDKHKKVLKALVKVYANCLSILNENERDQLTGLLNRRTFESKLNRLLSTQSNQHKNYSIEDKTEKRKVLEGSHAWLAMIDIDHFKPINDDYGHLYGDEVLLQISHLMKENFRKSDLLFRFGGEEFLVVLEPTPYDVAYNVLNRFKNAVEDYSFSQIGKVTVSIGFEKVSESDFAPSVVSFADKALYYAKENGRNCIYNYRQLIESGKIDKPDFKEGIVEIF